VNAGEIDLARNMAKTVIDDDAMRAEILRQIEAHKPAQVSATAD